MGLKLSSLEEMMVNLNQLLKIIRGINEKPGQWHVRKADEKPPEAEDQEIYHY